MCDLKQVSSELMEKATTYEKASNERRVELSRRLQYVWDGVVDFCRHFSRIFLWQFGVNFAEQCIDYGAQQQASYHGVILQTSSSNQWTNLFTHQLIHQCQIRLNESLISSINRKMQYFVGSVCSQVMQKQTSSEMGNWTVTWCPDVSKIFV